MRAKINHKGTETPRKLCGFEF